MFDHILFPTDGSDHAETVRNYALDIVQKRDATLHVFSVVDDRAFLTLDDDRVEDVRNELHEEAQAAIDDAVTGAQEHGIGTVSDTAVGSPSEAIIEYIESEPIDLVVMGTSGDNYERNVVGSVSQRVVEQSPVPVMTIGLDVDA
jgi:nucleotide-binding universal stress UspA family protein